MKKKLVIIILLAIFLIGASIGVYSLFNKKVATTDGVKFKTEYEKLNSILGDNGENEYMTLNLPDTSMIKYSSYEEIFNVIENGTGIIYLGFPECPWCRNAITPLLEVMSDNAIDTVYYLNIKDDRDTLVLDESGNIVTEKEGTDNYKKLVDLLRDNLGEYKGLNDSTIKRIYLPSVIFVKDGTVVGIHVSTVDSHTVGRTPLDDEQKTELKGIYQELVDKTYGGVCDQSC